MSLNIRLGLLAGSSLAAAVLAPSMAVAQAVCVAAPTSGGGTSNVTYAAGTYNPGITCEAGGDMTVVTSGAVIVSGSGGVPADPLVNGVNLIGDGAEDVSWTSTAGTLTGGAQTNGAVIDVRTAGGDIAIRTGTVSANGATVTNGIEARSATGSIAITTLGNVNAVNTTTGDTGVRAVTTGASGGNIGVTVGDANTTTSASLSGRQRGLYAETEAGDITLNLHRSVTGSATAGSVGVEAISGGDLTVNLAGTARVNAAGGVAAAVTGGSAGAGLRIGAAGNATVNVGTRGSLAGAWGLDAAIASGTTTTLNIANHAGDFDSQNDGSVNAVRASGGGALVINNDADLRGALNFTGLTGALTLNIGAEGFWLPREGSIELGDGDATLNAEGVVFTGAFVNAATVHQKTFDFGGGDDAYDNAGFLVVNAASNNSDNNISYRPQDVFFAGVVEFSGLETFTNRGLILLGGIDDGDSDSNSSLGQTRGNRINDVEQGTDRWYDDVLSMPGATFVGDGGRIAFDVTLNNGPQLNCTDRNADGDLAAADCLMLVGGETQGTTYVTLNDLYVGDRGAYIPEGIVLVDVSGGTSAQGHFLIDPDNQNYSAGSGGVIDKGVFFYALIYDEEDQRHKLFGLPGDNTLQLPLVTQAAHELWRVSTGSWLDRQADLRDDMDDGMGGGVWLRASMQAASRDVGQSVTGGGAVFDFDNSFTQDSYAVTGGLDLMSRSQGDMALVFGVMAGYAHSDMEYDASSNTVRFDGWSGGLYASYVSGGLHVDAAVNANRLVMDVDIPAMDLFPTGTLLSTRLLSVGGRVEAGWRFSVTEGAFVEPLASLAYVKTSYDDLILRSSDVTRGGATAEFDDPTSLRAGLGGRIGMDQDYGGVRAQYSLLGRVWNEFEGASQVILHNVGPDAVVADEFSGAFAELGVGVSIYGAGDAFSGFVQLGGEFGEDYQALSATAGLRFHW